ncbi:galactose-1-phosphate uridylyltransferase, family 1 [Marinitoga piezophila KA3]|uniref:Galactose-1-phosphate uridylyltransferase n=1 Tax=Marinitoga piezophila (strain DSM 14283 / JCM 11233 / KA3) TaxID=443254 RepID=H2J758_MARPK|nr:MULTISPECIES: galactose-1-phosphate uridylyltransferase [Marinitoga]AEX86428.1 galactose-1-phosphate uridylyltransferase, family 1 [Marinitoga piezophila KA3]APT76816.1 galactose-1-phosphate uridylyltransferase [Marinitoga sp. 1137]
MLERRYNPITDEWVMISSSRQKRPNLPKDSCPICPGVLELPEEYDLVSFENRFPALKRDAESVENNSEILKKASSQGICEVVVYTKEHNSELSKMPLTQIEKLTSMWADRTLELSKYEFIKYIYIFENKGKEVGATLPHPHGQLYAFPFLPPRIKVKINALKKWYSERKTCSICEIINEEKKLNERIIYENETMIAIVPFYARYPYEVHLYPKRHISSIYEMTGKEKKDFSKALKIITSKYNGLFNMPFPYMMMFFQKPFNLPENMHYFHFHVEFISPMRGPNLIKWIASVESGTWAFINPIEPEKAAEQLRNIEVNIND